MSAHINKLNNYLCLSFWVFIALLYKTFTVPFIEMGSYARVVEVVIALQVRLLETIYDRAEFITR